MNDEAMKADNGDPDYRKAMLYHSDRADAYMAERDAARAEADALAEKLEHIVDEYDGLPWGPVIHAIAPARATLAALEEKKDGPTS